VLSPATIVDAGNRLLNGELGRVVADTVAAVANHRSGLVPRSGALREPERELVDAASGLCEATGKAIEAYDFGGALDAVWRVVGSARSYAEDNGVAALVEGGSEPRRLDTMLYVLAEVCRLIAHSLEPLLPQGAAQIAQRLGVGYEGQPPAERHKWGLTRPQTPVADTSSLFPRISLPTE
jgi:methionyl-tRNA synthetase